MQNAGLFDISKALDVFDFNHVSLLSCAGALLTSSLWYCVCPFSDSCSSRIALGQGTQTSGSSESASKNHCQPQIDDGLCLSDTVIKAACLFLILIFMHSEDRMFLLLIKKLWIVTLDLLFNISGCYLFRMHHWSGFCGHVGTQLPVCVICTVLVPHYFQNI